MKAMIVMVCCLLGGLIAYLAGTYYHEYQRGERNKEQVVGTWYHANYPLTFAKDGTVTLASAEGEVHGTYTIAGNDLTIVITDDGRERVLSFVVKIIGNVLFLYPEGSERFVAFERKE